MEEINWWSILLSTLTPSAIGYIYYHRLIFGKPWMNSIGFTEEKVRQANMPLVFGLSFVMAFLISFYLINFNNGPGQEGEFDNFGHGAVHGAFLSIFFIIPVFVMNGLFEQKSWKNMLLNAGYWLITLSVMGGILDAMNHWP